MVLLRKNYLAFTNPFPGLNFLLLSDSADQHVQLSAPGEQAVSSMLYDVFGLKFVLFSWE